MDDGPTTKVMGIYKGPCFGRCPVYQLTIYDNQMAILEARANMERKGTYRMRLEQDTYRQLSELYKEADLFNLPDNFPSDVMDAPKTTISVWKDGNKKSVMYDLDKPDILQKIEDQMDELLKSSEWEAEDEMARATDASDPNIYNELILKMDTSVDLPVWVDQFTLYKLEFKKPIGISKDTYLMTYDTTRIKPMEMMKKMKAQPEVKGAEFNKKVMIR